MTKKTQLKEMEAALASVMRLLVLIRETLMATGDTSSPLFATVSAHAQMAGTLIPDKARMSAAELIRLREYINGTVKSGPVIDLSETAPKPDPVELQKRLSAGNIIVLDRAHFAAGKLPGNQEPI